jgi:mono/diheme cytochrome c family protein
MTRTLALLLLVAACSGPSTPLPADVDAVFADKCQTCHGDPLAFGAEFALLSWEDTQAPAPTDPDRPIWEVARDRVHSTARPMPPPGLPALTAAELAILDAWFDAGAPPADQPE